MFRPIPDFTLLTVKKHPVMGFLPPRPPIQCVLVVRVPTGTRVFGEHCMGGRGAANTAVDAIRRRSFPDGNVIRSLIFGGGCHVAGCVSVGLYKESHNTANPKSAF